jgi:hypothetical protein
MKRGFILLTILLLASMIFISGCATINKGAVGQKVNSKYSVCNGKDSIDASTVYSAIKDGRLKGWVELDKGTFTYHPDEDEIVEQTNTGFIINPQLEGGAVTVDCDEDCSSGECKMTQQGYSGLTCTCCNKVVVTN